ncbi:MAPEG family protein [Maricaulis parjimensis]|uniref:MAPEG family protein n=1 Tax=Maricaulis parjimensis TaxID=144023 RepID=UPI00193A8F51|nr:MAPEG family protein [Maricaulis parjimensis]
MTALQALALYAGLNTLLLIGLALNVSRIRRRDKVSLGTGSNDLLERAVRAHANGIENVALGLICLWLLVTIGYGPIWVHALGFALTFGRGFYSYGLLSKPGPSLGRITGTGLTWLMLLVSALLLIGHAFT